MRKFLYALFAVIAVAATLWAPSASAANTTNTANTNTANTDNTVDAAETAAAANHTITFVNRTGEKIWIGSGVNADGSRNLTGLPTLQPGQSATITIPESSAPHHWRGKFFARQDCDGAPGSTFRCRVADCGPMPDRCTHGEQPASLAEFNFARHDPLAPWYNVSYVNAFSLPITIEPRDWSAPPGSPECQSLGCAQNLLPYCPPQNLTRWPDGRPMLCTNPNRDAPTDYSRALASRCPRAYAWSGHDREPGNQLVRQCRKCSGFNVVFHRASR
ncbi:thaumatin family protein [Streptoalloteichus hindustanus]|uniref:Thaumatin family protein n=1 Tax=Streptoalloteichus hindustanus TaxID=2017 RepID=A0A1M5CSM6_STRHI|nr:thaumatin family protein [Streptoalloteichus hindustanus]SHF57745.1 Thaumatin family protein [Streptoalloteichus hindustanus]